MSEPSKVRVLPLTSTCLPIKFCGFVAGEAAVIWLEIVVELRWSP